MCAEQKRGLLCMQKKKNGEYGGIGCVREYKTWDDAVSEQSSTSVMVSRH